MSKRLHPTRATLSALGAIAAVAGLGGCANTQGAYMGPVTHNVVMQEGESIRMVAGPGCIIEFPFDMPAAEATLDESKAALVGEHFSIMQNTASSSPCWLTADGWNVYRTAGFTLNQGDSVFMSIPHGYLLEGEPDKYALLTTVSCPESGFATTQRTMHIAKDGCVIDTRLTRHSALGLDVPHENYKPGDDLRWPSEQSARNPHKYDIRLAR